MKRKIVGSGGVILALALAGIGGWYVIHTQSTQAELNRAVADYESRKPVPVSFKVTVPANTPKDQVLYLSGSVPALGNWDAAGVPLTRGDDGTYHADVPDLLNGMEYTFKVTRGTWGTVETDKDGKGIDNHGLTAAKDAKVDVVVANWIDNGQSVPGRVTMMPGIRVHKNAIKSAALGNQRTLIVYLPPNYDKDVQQRYPVLYLQDGQNLFDEATSYQGVEWKLDETAQQLITAGKMKPAIIVGIYNSEQRAVEFTPPFAEVAKEQTRGELYAKMLADDVKKFIDERYRTKPDRANTIIGGGSMGALISLYAAKTHSDVFGGVVALSPWLRLGDKPVISDIIGDGKWLKNTRLFVDMGTEGGHNYPGGAANAIADGEQFVAAMEKAGVAQGEQFQYRIIEGGKHNEASWQATADQVLIALFGTSEPPSTSPTSAPVAASR